MLRLHSVVVFVVVIIIIIAAAAVVVAVKILLHSYFFSGPCFTFILFTPTCRIQRSQK
jgi:hypothetical protein